MASKLTQAEKQRRAGIESALKAADRLACQYSRDIESAEDNHVRKDIATCQWWTVLCVMAEVRALLAPKPQPKSRRIRSYKKRGKGERK